MGSQEKQGGSERLFLSDCSKGSEPQLGLSTPAVKGGGRGFSRQSLVVWAFTHSLWALGGGENT